MTNYSDRRRQDLGPMYTETQASPYSSSGGLGYFHNHDQVQYHNLASNYPTYSTSYVPSHNSLGSMMYLPTSTHGPMSYHVQPPPRSATLPSQRHVPSQNHFYSSDQHQRRSSHAHYRLPIPSDTSLIETEDQESVNDETMKSEPIEPPLDGYPDVRDFDDLMKRYVEQLSPKKQDKALIHARRAQNIKIVLLDKKTTAVESAQFRFWVKKMFTLLPNDPAVSPRKRRICHEGKPVAVREKLFKILTRAHQKCQHGGRDKTSAQVRRVYSWIPKELISRFVKLCPTCQIRRGTNRGSPAPEDETSPSNCVIDQSPNLSSSKSRSNSIATVQTSNSIQSPLQLVGGSSTFQNQNRWMTGIQPVENGLHSLSSERQSDADSASSATPYNTGHSYNGLHNSAWNGADPFPFNELHNSSSRYIMKNDGEYKDEAQF